tara:strand:- start:939 stop:1721 length:783 start_codon:yes stop_codon:yes gene_type:complete
MSDFCIESTAIHNVYIEEYNNNFDELSSLLPDTQFYCVTDKPDKIIKKDNITPVDIKKYTDTIFQMNYKQNAGFPEILQATRYGLYEAYENNYLKVLHLQSDMFVIDKKSLSSEKVSNHFKTGIYFDLGGTNANLLYNNTCGKVKHLITMCNLKGEIERMPMGDDPVVFFKFKDKDQYTTYLDNLEKLCEETFKHEAFTTGLAAELSIAMYQTGTRSYYNYHGVLHRKEEKLFDVNNNYLHVRHYEDKDPQMARNLGIKV